MENLTGAPRTDTETILALLGGCNSETDGIELAYQALDLVIARYHLAGAQLVLRPGSMTPQIFVSGRRHVPPGHASALAQRPSGLYASPDAVPLPVQDALTGCCEMALAAHSARLSAGGDVAGLASRSMMEDAVRRAASRGARFRWQSTLVVLATSGPGSEAKRWRALAAAVRSARRVCDEAGVAGPAQAAAILADAGREDVDAYVDRVRAALALDGEDDVDLLIGGATTPSDSVDPDRLWELCAQRQGEEAPTDGEGSASRKERRRPLSEVELELRSLPDVVSVGTTGFDDPEPTHRSVTVVARHGDEALDHKVAALVAAHLPGVAVAVLSGGGATVPFPVAAGVSVDSALVVSGNGGGLPALGGVPLPAVASTAGPAGPAVPVVSVERRADQLAGTGGTTPRVVLLLSQFDPATGTSEVSLAWRGATAAGQAVGTPLAGAAQATLSAVEALGTRVPYYVTSVERASSDPRAPVVVVLSSRRAGASATPDRRFGVAQGRDEVTAASRATLSALNRYLSLTASAR
jgi:hypothetical protein